MQQGEAQSSASQFHQGLHISEVRTSLAFLPLWCPRTPVREESYKVSPLTSSVALGREIHFSEPQCPHV